MKARLPQDEEARLEALHRYRILDTEAEEVYDNVSRLAAHLCGVPISAVSLVDEDRQWFKARVGIDTQQIPRDLSLCAHAIDGTGVLVVPDTLQDERFADNPFAKPPSGIRFYAGAPLVTPDGYAIGTLCVMDHKPGALSPSQTETLQALSRHVVAQMEMRRAAAGQALVLASIEDAHKRGEGYAETIALAATYLSETAPVKAYLSSDAALARFYGYKSFDELATLLDDV